MTQPNNLLNSVYHFHIFKKYISDCITDSDCPNHLECRDDGKCVNPPCPDCGSNAHCKGSNHTGICLCHSDYPIGDPYLGCVGKQN